MLAFATRLRFDPNQACGRFPLPSLKPAPVITDPLFYAVSIVAVILLGLSKGGFFGLGVMALPLMSLFVPPLQAAAILIPTVIAQDTLTVWTYRHDWSAWNLKVMLPGMAVGILIGTLLAASLEPVHIRLAIGLIAAAFVLRHWLGQRFDRLASRSNTVTGVAFGALGGFTTLLANAGGPAWQMHLLPQKLDKFTYAGTLTMLFAVSNLMKIPAYHALGQVTVDNMLVGLLLLPAALLANYVGLWLVRRTPTELFFRIAYVLMLFISIELIRGAVTEMARS
jgi:uncharacterized membrane protein YfcA